MTEPRKVVVYELVSVDGVAQDPDEFVTDWDDAADADLADVIATQDAVILGRRSYDEWSLFWPTSDLEPFATFINGAVKYVATSTPLAREWVGSTVIDGDPVVFVHDLKEQAGGDIGVHASLSLVRSLLNAGVVDELRLAIAPTIAGKGRRLLDGVDAARLELIGSSSTPSGLVLARYRIVR